MLRVSDNGQRIPAAIFNRIFEPFLTTKEIGKGTGLGLATVYSVVKQCRGSIRVESAVGQGTAFIIHLPPVNEPAIAEEPIIATELPKGSETVLIVEDEASIRGLTKQMLASCGYTVLEAERGQHALQLDKGYLGRRALQVRSASGESCLPAALLKLSQSTALDTEPCLRKSTVVWMRAPQLKLTSRFQLMCCRLKYSVLQDKRRFDD